MRLNKVGQFTMKNLGQSKSVVADFMKKKKQELPRQEYFKKRKKV
jgi:magnesium chelatase subunit H